MAVNKRDSERDGAHGDACEGHRLGLGMVPVSSPDAEQSEQADGRDQPDTSYHCHSERKKYSRVATRRVGGFLDDGALEELDCERCDQARESDRSESEPGSPANRPNYERKSDRISTHERVKERGKSQVETGSQEPPIEDTLAARSVKGVEKGPSRQVGSISESDVPATGTERQRRPATLLPSDLLCLKAAFGECVEPYRRSQIVRRGLQREAIRREMEGADQPGSEVREEGEPDVGARKVPLAGYMPAGRVA